MLILSKAQIYQALDWTEAIDAIAAGYAALAKGEAVVPLRIGFPQTAQNGLLLLMSGAISSNDLSGLGVKLVSVFNDNPSRNLPLIYGLVALFEPDTGRPLALFDGATVTAVRTGAVSGVATRLLARPEADTLALFGAGVQAETQLLAIAAVRKLQKVKVFSRTPAKAKQFAQKMSNLINIPVEVAHSPAEALQGAQIVATATTSTNPVFEDANLEDGTHINGVGSYTPDMAEVPAQTVARSRLIIDTLEGCMAEAGDVLQPLNAKLFDQNHIYAEIGELCANLKPARQNNTEITFFKSVGNAVQDVALAAYLYQKAKTLQIGTEVELY
jgi:ornithine cyclodeaminase/alanine dehydrogenase-like protein (mu-crystallin family)